MNREELKKYVPHREPMLLVDEVEMSDKTHAVGKYEVTGNEWFLKGHFPGNPIVPGVVLCEIMAQASSILIADKIQGRIPFFAGIDKARFRNKVVPGDTLDIECSLIKERGPFYFVSAKGYVKGKLSVTGEFSFALVDA
jgi:3-hydroxyacyl-[acyl-carrier-protein] dehydratase